MAEEKKVELKPVEAVEVPGEEKKPAFKHVKPWEQFKQSSHFKNANKRGNFSQRKMGGKGG